MKKILIAGVGSYIGDSCKEYLEQYPEQYHIDLMDTMGLKPSPSYFRDYDVVFCVAGIAHVKETKENKYLYFDVNRDLVIRIAKAAKKAGVKQFILLSSMSVYGREIGFIRKNTKPQPKNAYGKSKLQADLQIQKFADESFKFVCLRPPMVYGKNCKGNYQSLRKFALKSPVFFDCKNRRSMIYIGNLCEFVKRCVDDEYAGLFFPQNAEYVDISDMVKKISEAHRKKVRLINIEFLNLIIQSMPFDILKKVFGNLIYEDVDKVYKYSFEESIFLTEL